MKTKLIFVVSILILNFFSPLLWKGAGGEAFSQNWLWAKNASGTSIDEGYGIATDTSGNVYITGGFNSPTIDFGLYTLNRIGGKCNVFLAKYDAAGNVLWAKGAGGPGGSFGDMAFSVATDTLGNVYVTGSFDSQTISFNSYTLTNVNPGFSDVFLAKYDAGGNVLWARRAGGVNGNGDVGHGVATNGLGDVYVTGYFGSSSISFGSYTLTSSGNIDIFLAKYDALGNVIWAQRGGGGNYDGIGGVTTDGSGDVYITGYFGSPYASFGSYTLTSSSNDIFLVKYNASGNVLWAKKEGGTGDDRGSGVAADNAGNVYVTGEYTSASINFGSYTFNNVGTWDVFLFKYDVLGNPLWAKSAGSGNWDYGFSVATDALGNVYMEGSFSTFGPSPITSIAFDSYTLTFPSGGKDPIFIVKYDSIGNVQCASALASGGEDINAVATDLFGNAYIISDFEISDFEVVKGDTMRLLSAVENVFVAKYDCNTILTNAANTNLLCNSQCTGVASALTIGGRSPYSYNWSNGQTTKIITGLCAGTYTVIVTDVFNATTTTTVTITEPLALSVTLTSTSLTCNGGNNGSATTAATGGAGSYVYLWSTLETTSTVSNLTSSTYSVTIKDANGCISEQTISITQPPAITYTVISIPDTCGKAKGTAGAHAANGIPPYTYLWSNGYTTSQISNLTSQIYSVTITDNNGCTQTEAINVGITGVVIANAGPDITITQGSSAPLFATGGITYNWNPAAGLSCDTCSDPIASPTKTTIYIVSVTDIIGCTDTDTVIITVEIPCHEIYVPNAFSPNRDGQNELECVLGNCIESLNFKIYNRWGEKVFETNDPKICWDGMYQGKEMKAAVFTYYLNATLLDKQVVIKKGNITLIK